MPAYGHQRRNGSLDAAPITATPSVVDRIGERIGEE
jgi:hypothetical protein